MVDRNNAPRSVEGFSTLDALLAEEGTLNAFEAVAVREVRAWQRFPVKPCGVGDPPDSA